MLLLRANVTLGQNTRTMLILLVMLLLDVVVLLLMQLFT